MSTTAAAGGSLARLLFDYPGADIILRSQDSYNFRVPKIYISNSSPILGELIQSTLDSPSEENAEALASLSIPVVHVPKRGEIVHCLLTLIFPVTPFVPSTPEEILELLSVAQTYQMDSVLTHIRDIMARQNSLPTRLEPALRIYSLAQEYRLLPEALRTASIILNYPMTTIEDYDDNLDIMSGASLYELWNYHERVRAVLATDLTEFRMSFAHSTITGLRCTELSSSQIPRWLDQYIESIGKTPNLFDSAELNIVMARHTKDTANQPGCECASISGHTIREFWDALTTVVNGSFKKAESALSLEREREGPQIEINSATSPFESFDVPDANLIIQSSDNVNFRVHKSVLAMASPFFQDLLSLPQPPDSENVDGLPVVQVSESAELLNSLISILYPVRTVVPNSYEKVLYLLAACQKYEMASAQSFIRSELKRGGEFPSPKGTEAFSAYAIASFKELIPEIKSAARLTLDQPMTFEILGKGLRFFEGWVLSDLAYFRKRCKHNLITCLELFLEAEPPGPSSIWVNCPEAVSRASQEHQNRVLPTWLNNLLLRNQNDLELQKFAGPLDIHLRIRGEYFTALQNHGNCYSCWEVHIRNGSTFCAELENSLAQACNKVRGVCGSHSDSTYLSPRNR